MRGVTHQRVGFSLRAAMVAAVLMLPLTANAAPVLLGDSVDAVLFGIDVTTPFAASAVVGDGAEFTGRVNTGFKAYWDWGFDGRHRRNRLHVGSDGVPQRQFHRQWWHCPRLHAERPELHSGSDPHRRDPDERRLCGAGQPRLRKWPKSARRLVHW
jgi:hypothetical protein